MAPEKRNKIREGKAKILFEASEPHSIIQYFKDDATAFNALKKGQIKNKGMINNQISTWIFKHLERLGIQTHFIEKISDREMLIKEVKIIPIEMVVRNRAAGGICKRLGIEKGKSFEPPLVEYFLKSDELGDPLISEGHIFYFKWATPDDLMKMVEKSLLVNKYLREVFDEIGLELIDFKLEFGKDKNGCLLLSDEFTPDGCRLWDKKTNESMDKDRFRQDLGRVDEAYEEVYQRLDQYFRGKL